MVDQIPSLLVAEERLPAQHRRAFAALGDGVVQGPVGLVPHMGRAEVGGLGVEAGRVGPVPLALRPVAGGAVLGEGRPEARDPAETGTGLGWAAVSAEMP